MMKSKVLRPLLFSVCILMLLLFFVACEQPQDKKKYYLTVNCNEAHGHVESSASGNILDGTAVNVVAVANESYTFLGWYINDVLTSENREHSFVMPKYDLTLTAKFALQHALVTLVEPDLAQGSVSISDAAASVGAEVTVIASPQELYKFVGWFNESTLISENATYKFIVQSTPINLEARFIRDKFYLTIKMVTPENDGTNSNIGYFVSDTLVNLPLASDNYYEFSAWMDEDNTLLSSDPNYKLKMPNDDTIIIAKYEAIDVAIDVKFASELGTVLDYTKSAKSGSGIELVAENGIDGIFDGWFIDGVIYTTDKKLTYKVLKNSATQILAKFSERKYAFTVIMNSTEVEITGDTYNTDYAYGASIKVTAVPRDGYDFAGWYVENEFARNSFTFEFTMPRDPYEIEVRLVKLLGYTAHAYHDGMGSILESNSGVFSSINPVTIEAAPKTGYKFDGWYVERQLISTNSRYTLETQESAADFIARFTMTGLTYVEKGNDVVYIDGYEGSLTSFVVPDMYEGKLITGFNSRTFANRTLGTIELPNTLVCGDSYPFRDATIEKAIFADGTVEIIEYILSFATISELVIPDSVKSIKQMAFQLTTLLNDFVLPDGIESMQMGFAYTKIPNLILGPNRTILPDGAFAGSWIEKFTLNDKLEEIGDSAFSSSKNLTSITIPASVKRLQNAVFEHTPLEAITIPSTLESIGVNLFQMCVDLKSVVINADIHIPSGSFLCCSALEYVELNGKIKSIGSVAFMGCRLLKSITIPGSVSYIDDRAFAACSSLSQVNLSDGIGLLSTDVFLNCYSLKSIYLPLRLHISIGVFSDFTLDYIIVGPIYELGIFRGATIGTIYFMCSWEEISRVERLCWETSPDRKTFRYSRRYAYTTDLSEYNRDWNGDYMWSYYNGVPTVLRDIPRDAN
ncbi:MAG: leucine-rich repeat protein [Christensenellaceae bacterium]|jgi:uncharacterized repeat protein (TIGR02543 family)|nr:leucine-rich repeat protein [Christensenellaceae bacterium]